VGISEGPAGPSPVVHFRRASSGLLDIVGFSVPAGRHARTFLLSRPARPDRAALTAQTVPAVEVDAPHSYGSVALRRAAD
jgi:hypothetical protein